MTPAPTRTLRPRQSRPSKGRTRQLWQVDIVDEAARLIATGQVRLQGIEPPTRGEGSRTHVHGSGVGHTTHLRVRPHGLRHRLGPRPPRRRRRLRHAAGSPRRQAAHGSRPDVRHGHGPPTPRRHPQHGGVQGALHRHPADPRPAHRVDGQGRGKAMSTAGRSNRSPTANAWSATTATGPASATNSGRGSAGPSCRSTGWSARSATSSGWPQGAASRDLGDGTSSWRACS